MNELTCSASPLSGHPPQMPECPICLKVFDTSQRTVTTTECQHIFDATCLSTWLSLSQTCPICSVALSERTVAVAPECALCLDDLFFPEKEVSVTSCHHKFHTDCVNHSCSIELGCPDCHQPLSQGDITSVKADPLSPVSLEICSLCNDVLDHRAALMSMPCNRLFHRRCLTPFLSSQCPLCASKRLGEDYVFPGSFDSRQTDGYKQVMDAMTELVEKFCL